MRGKNLKKQDVIIGTILAFASGVIFFLIRSSELHSESQGEVGLSPAFFPELAFLLIFFLSCLMIILSYFKSGERQPAEAVKIINLTQMRQVGTIFLVLIVYVILINIVGYYISSFATLLTLFWIFRVKSWYTILPVSILLMVMVFFFFEMGLKVLLPRGFLF